MKKKILGVSVTKKVLSVSVAVLTALSLVGIAWASGYTPEPSGSTEADAGGATGAPTAAILETPTPLFSSSSSSSSSDDDSHDEDHEDEDRTEVALDTDFPVELSDGTTLVATVTFSVDNGDLTADVTPATNDWTCEVKAEDEDHDGDSDHEDDEDEIKIECVNTVLGLKVEIKAELDGDGNTVWIKVEVEELDHLLATAGTPFEVFLPDGTTLVATVTFSVDNGDLTADVTPATNDWTCEVKAEDEDHDGDSDHEDDEDEIKIECVNTVLGLKVEIKAELKDGEIWVEIKVEQVDEEHQVVADTSATCEVPDVGTVKVKVANGELMLDGPDAIAAQGWTYDIEDEDGHEIEIKFSKDGQKVEFKAEVEHGQIECKTKSSDDGDDQDEDHGNEDDNSDHGSEHGEDD